MDPAWRHRESNRESANISSTSNSKNGKIGYKKGVGSLSWVRKYLNNHVSDIKWTFIGLIMGVTLVILLYPITLSHIVIGIITGGFSGIVAQILISVQK